MNSLGCNSILHFLISTLLGAPSKAWCGGTIQLQGWFLGNHCCQGVGDLVGEQGVESPSSITFPETQSIVGLYVASQGYPKITFSSHPNWVAKNSCSMLLLLIRRVSRILFLIRPLVFLELSAFLTRVDCQSFCSGHFILLVKLMSMQQIMALLSTRVLRCRSQRLPMFIELFSFDF